MLLLLPQSDKIREFTQKKISLKKFTTPECLLGLVTAEELGLATTADNLLQFINNNLGKVALRKDRADIGKIVDGADTASPMEMLELISKHIKAEDEETQKKILRSLDTSSFSKDELVDLVRNNIVIVTRIKFKGFSLMIYKDSIVQVSTIAGEVFFFPQHFSKLE